MKPKLTLSLTLAVIIAAAAGYLLLSPVPIEPRGWQPPRLKAAPDNTALNGIERLAMNVGVGPEGVSMDRQGRLYAGYVDGRVMRFTADGTSPELLANTGGRPWGTRAAADGSSVLVADAVRGLLRVSPGRVEVLSTSAAGRPFRQTDDVDLASDGRIYFSDASSEYGIDRMMDNVLEHGDGGRLLRFDPATGKTEVLMDGLHVANGVTLGPGEDYVLVAETLEYRVWRYWLKGERAGQSEVLIDNLPGFPDNISYNGRDAFWLALFAPRDPALDAALPYPFLLKIVYRIPEFLRPKAARKAHILKLDLNGAVLADLQGNGKDTYAPITSVREAEGMLYFGSIEYPALGRMPLPRQ